MQSEHNQIKPLPVLVTMKDAKRSEEGGKKECDEERLPKLGKGGRKKWN